MPFTEDTLALANMCLVMHVMGKLFNIMKELSYKTYFWKFTFAKSSPITHTQLLQKHAVNRFHIHTMYI